MDEPRALLGGTFFMRRQVQRQKTDAITFNTGTMRAAKRLQSSLGRDKSLRKAAHSTIRTGGRWRHGVHRRLRVYVTTRLRSEALHNLGDEFRMRT